jgi:hypothetical protein
VGSFAGGLLALRLRRRRPFFATFLGYLPFGTPSLLLAPHAPAIGVAGPAWVAGGRPDDHERALGDDMLVLSTPSTIRGVTATERAE